MVVLPPLGPGDSVPPVPLVDQRGAPFSLARLHGNAVIVSFIYMRCAQPAMCPLVSAKFARIQARIGNDPVRLVEITLDPAFDSPRVLRAYGHAFGARPARWTLATGAPASIDELAGRFGIATRTTQPGTIEHTEAAIVLDRAGRIAQVVDGNAWTPDAMLALARETAGVAPPSGAGLTAWLASAVAACGGRSALRVEQVIAIGLALCTLAIVVLWRAFRPLRADRAHDLVE